MTTETTTPDVPQQTLPQQDDAITPVPVPTPPPAPAPAPTPTIAELEQRLLTTTALDDADTTEIATPCGQGEKKRSLKQTQRSFLEYTDRKWMEFSKSTIPRNRAKVPNTIWLIWVGGEIPDDYATRIEKVAQDHPDFTVNVLLSETLSKTPEDFEANKRKVEGAGANVELLEGEHASKLEAEGMLKPLIWEWRLTDGPNNIINYGAISDILRLYILKERGGTYIDTDNTITTPLPRDVVPKYGFQYGAFGSRTAEKRERELAKEKKTFDTDPAEYVSAIQNDNPRDPHRNKPSTISNSVLVSVPQGQIINSYWNNVKDVYVPLADVTEEKRFEKLRWKATHTEPRQQREAMSMATLNNTGPRALEFTLADTRLKGESTHGLIRPALSPWEVHSNEAKHLVVDPKHVYIRSDNSWVREIDAGIAAGSSTPSGSGNASGSGNTKPSPST
ncbi:glycosyltransferase [Chondromyces crocatus]|uniref:Uncharacterized protein n=1 Tax=Chondromyces crocatus TaxID=52 RepID=A0A0K1EBV3_CHOCO|nr:glycosyltransferase [Chondromyces crocatus]AKT38366.1 uncharacterized protein CMC5_025120 [Chondromyces crocatus]